jgi:hypothetical protein
MNLPGPTFTELLEAERDREDEQDFRRLMQEGLQTLHASAQRMQRLLESIELTPPCTQDLERCTVIELAENERTNITPEGIEDVDGAAEAHYRHKYKEAPRKRGVIREGQEMLLNEYFVTERAFIIAKLQEWEEAQADSDDSLCDKGLVEANSALVFE